MKYVSVLIYLILNISTLFASTFEMIPLGVYGGAIDGNISSYLLRLNNSDYAIALDAGSLVNGLMKIDSQLTVKQKLNSIKAYLITHAHFDHNMGLIAASPDIHSKPSVMARQETLATLKKYAFNWEIWGNFGDSGDEPHLNLFHYQQLPLKKWQALPQMNGMQVKTYPLNHGKNYPSSAFLINKNQNYVLYLGDVGADSINHDNKLFKLWHDIAPLVRNKQLKAIMMECSYPEEQANDKLFGHLKPSLFLDELSTLAMLVDSVHANQSLSDVAIFITHVKPKLGTKEKGFRATVMHQLQQQAKERNLRINLILPQQAKHYFL